MDFPTAIALVKKCFEEDSWTFRTTENSDKKRYHFQFGVKGDNWPFQATLSVVQLDDGTVGLRVVVPRIAIIPNLSPEKRAEILEYLLTLNGNLVVGAFLYMPKSSEIRLAYARVVNKSTTMTTEDVRDILHPVFTTADLEYPNIMAKIWGNSPPPLNIAPAQASTTKAEG